MRFNRDVLVLCWTLLARYGSSQKSLLLSAYRSTVALDTALQIGLDRRWTRSRWRHRSVTSHRTSMIWMLFRVYAFLSSISVRIRHMRSGDD